MTRPVKIELPPGTEYVLNGHTLIAPEHHPVHAALVSTYDADRARIEREKLLQATAIAYGAPVYVAHTLPQQVLPLACAGHPHAPDVDETSGSETQTAAGADTSPTAPAAAANEDVLPEIERAIAGVRIAEWINARPVQQTGVAMTFLSRARSHARNGHVKHAREQLAAAQRIMRGDL